MIKLENHIILIFTIEIAISIFYKLYVNSYMMLITVLITNIIQFIGFVSGFGLSEPTGKAIPPTRIDDNSNCGNSEITVSNYNEKFYDLFGSINFIVILSFFYFMCEKVYDNGIIKPIIPLSSSLLLTPKKKEEMSKIISNIIKKESMVINSSQLLVLMIVGIWTIKLGIFLSYRALKFDGDSRFNDFKKNRTEFFNIWVIQGFWVIMSLFSILSSIMLSKYSYLKDILLENNINLLLEKKDLLLENNIHFYVKKALKFLGIFIALSGLTFETIADYEKLSFKLDIESKLKRFEKVEKQKSFIMSGLWAFCRHPNYFGEILFWIGLSILSSSQLFLFNHTIISILLLMISMIISPAFITYLLVFKSGIPILEKKADSKWGNVQEYIEYKENTPLLIPRIEQ